MDAADHKRSSLHFKTSSGGPRIQPALYALPFPIANDIRTCSATLAPSFPSLHCQLSPCRHGRSPSWVSLLPRSLWLSFITFRGPAACFACLYVTAGNRLPLPFLWSSDHYPNKAIFRPILCLPSLSLTDISTFSPELKTFTEHKYLSFSQAVLPIRSDLASSSPSAFASIPSVRLSIAH